MDAEQGFKHEGDDGPEEQGGSERIVCDVDGSFLLIRTRRGEELVHIYIHPGKYLSNRIMQITRVDGNPQGEGGLRARDMERILLLN